MLIQVRSEETGTRQAIMSLAEAIIMAENDKTIWKISFDARDGERVRLVRNDSDQWIYEPMCVAMGVDDPLTVDELRVETSDGKDINFVRNGQDQLVYMSDIATPQHHIAGWMDEVSPPRMPQQSAYHPHHSTP